MCVYIRINIVMCVRGKETTGNEMVNNGKHTRNRTYWELNCLCVCLLTQKFSAKRKGVVLPSCSQIRIKKKENLPFFFEVLDFIFSNHKSRFVTEISVPYLTTVYKALYH